MKSNKKINRRKFLGTSIAGTVGVAAATKSSMASDRDQSFVPVKPEEDLPFNSRTFAAMPTNAFGKTGYKVGILSLGGQAAIETQGKEELSEKIINQVTSPQNQLEIGKIDAPR